MKDVINNFDFFGTNLGFMIKKGTKYSTFEGGLVSILSTLLFFIIFILIIIKDCGRDFPFVCQSMTFLNDGIADNYNENYSSLYIYWKISDKFDMSINAEENDVANISTSIKISRCSSEVGNTIQVDDSQNIVVSEFNCFTLANKGTEFKLDIKPKKSDDNYYMEFALPKIFYQPLNYNKTSIIKYYRYYFKLEQYQTYDIDIIKYYFLDDKGWIFTKKNNYSLYGVNKIKKKEYYKNIEDINNDPSVFKININLKNEGIILFRQYTKLYQTIPKICGNIYFIYIILYTIIRFINYTKITKEVIEYYFEKINISPSTNNSKYSFNKFKKHDEYSGYASRYDGVNISDLYNKPVKQYRSQNNLAIINFKNNLIKNNEDKRKSSDLNENIKKNFNLKSNENIRKQEDNSFTEFKNRNEVIKLNKNYLNKDDYINNLKGSNKNNNLYIYQKQNILSNKEKDTFPFCYYFIKNININYFFCYSSTRLKIKYDLVINFIYKVLDYFSYLKLIKEFTLLKSELRPKNIEVVETIKKFDIENPRFLSSITESNKTNNLNFFGFLKNINRDEIPKL